MPENFKGTINQFNKIKNKLTIGQITKINFIDIGEKLNSFINNFTASLKGCKIPLKEVLFGPLRSCDKPKIFRSNKVKKATLTITGIIIIKK